MRKITIRDVAREARVGVGTVSRVLNHSDQVSQETREHVQAVIERMGFKPNAMARKLPKGNNFRTIGVITRLFDQYYSFAERLRGVQRAMRPHADEYELALYSLPQLTGIDERLTTIIQTRAMDALLVIDFDLTKQQKHLLRQQNIPFVGLNHITADDWTCIGVDNTYGGHLATRHLIKLGHQKIAYIGSQFVDAHGFNISEERIGGYRQALAEAGLPINEAYICMGELGFQPAYDMTKQLLALAAPPSAIFAMSDTQAFGCVAAIRDKGLTAGKDVSIIGFDDLEISHQTGLSTVRQHLTLSGELGVTYLINCLQNNETHEAPLLPAPQVIQRHTSGPYIP